MDYKIQQTYEPVPVLVVPGVGKYIWEPALQLVDFIPHGHRRANHSRGLSQTNNTEIGATRKAIKMLDEALKTGTWPK